jgi:hypothetical protein
MYRFGINIYEKKTVRQVGYLQDLWDVGGIAPFILNLGTRWDEWFSLVLSLFTPRKGLKDPLKRRVGGFPNQP